MRTDLPLLVAMLADLDPALDLTLTTNAYLLPQQAQALKDAGLKRVTVSLDTIDDGIFREMNGRGFPVQRVLDGIESAVQVGLSPAKINAVVQKGVNDHTVVDLARHFKGTGHIVRFIEYMDVGNRNGWKWDHVVPAADIVKLIDAELPLEPIASNYRGEVANRYRYRDGDGEIGVIAPCPCPSAATAPEPAFPPTARSTPACSPPAAWTCGTSCAPGASDSQLSDRIKAIWGRRADRYSEERAELAPLQNGRQKVEMYHIGG